MWKMIIGQKKNYNDSTYTSEIELETDDMSSLVELADTLKELEPSLSILIRSTEEKE